MREENDMNDVIDYAAKVKALPLAERMGGTIEHTDTGFKVKDATIFTPDGKSLFTQSIEVSFREPGNEESLVIAYGRPTDFNHYVNTQPSSWDEVIEVLSEEVVPFSEREWLAALNSSSVASRTSSSVVKKNSLLTDFTWSEGKTMTINIMAYLSTTSFKHYFTISNPEWGIAYVNSFDEVIEFLETSMVQ